MKRLWIDDHQVLTICIVFAIFMAVAGGALWSAPTRQERQRELDQKIAACRSLGGEPRLVYMNAVDRFYLNECWLPR